MEEDEDKSIGNVCDHCGKHIDVSSEGILTESGELLCIECQSSAKDKLGV